MTGTRAQFNVGGILLDQPFKIRRLGHVGLYVDRMAEAVHFYKDLLGFKITDVGDPLNGASTPGEYKSFGDLKSYFFRYGADHHAFVLRNRPYFRSTDTHGRFRENVTIDQISWQVGSLREVDGANRWLLAQRQKVVRQGRDMPGSNWHTYVMDPESHRNELYYGMEQIGWDGRSKPASMHYRDFDQVPPLPEMSEYAEVNEAMGKGIDLLSGYRDIENLPLAYDVDGIRLARPFKIVKHGPISLFVKDIGNAVAWYCDVLGFVVTEETTYEGYRCVFLRNNTEHHSLALFPMQLHALVGLKEDTTLAAFGVQIANYQQLLEAIAFLKSRGVRMRELPQELTPGMDHAIVAHDPDEHAILLYWSMEQVGWDGKPRPASERRKINPGEWPVALEANGDSYAGEPFLGPWS